MSSRAGSRNRREERHTTTQSLDNRYDWLRCSDTGKLTQWQHLFRNVNWRALPLGPIETWPPQLHAMVLMISSGPDPMCLWWGEEAIPIYNEHCQMLFGDLHPTIPGANPEKSLDRFWAEFGSDIRACRRHGAVRKGENRLLKLNRDGYVEENWFDWMFLPVFGVDGNVVGVYDQCREVTKMHIQKRRQATLDMLHQLVSTAISYQDVWTQHLLAIESNPFDLPLAILYTLTDNTGAPSTMTEKSNPEFFQCILQGALGVPDGHPIIPKRMSFGGSEGLAALFLQSTLSPDPVLLSTKDSNFPKLLVAGISWRGHQIPSDEAIVYPVKIRLTDIITGFLFVALNPLNRFDKDYHIFCQQICAQPPRPRLASLLAGEQERNGEGPTQNPLDVRGKFQDDIVTASQALEHGELNFRGFADTAPVGLWTIGLDGGLLYANKHHYQITGLSPADDQTKSWVTSMMDDDFPIVVEAFGNLMQGQSAKFEARMKRKWKAPPDKTGFSEEVPTTVLCSAKPNLEADGSFKSISGTMTDITESKYKDVLLLRKSREVIDSELKWTRFASVSPIGITTLNLEGKLTFGNDAFYEQTGHPRDEEDWSPLIYAEDLPMAQTFLVKLLSEKSSVNFELRLNAPKAEQATLDENGLPYVWYMCTGYAERDDDGNLKFGVSILNNIHAQKTAEEALRVRMVEAIETKRQQQEFVDITSHEMRNPLSAILHCAEELSTTLGVCESLSEQARTISETKLQECIEAAQTITYCAQHQKRIVDDILILSRLDSNLLLITPVAVQPVQMIRNALRIFEAELRSTDIQIRISIEKSLSDIQVDWVLMDPSRTLQVTINLITNAIKFTRSEARRIIQVSLGASSHRPVASSALEYFPKRKETDDVTSKPEWGTGEVVYLKLAVEDTGRGMSAEEKKLLFMRFSQTSPRTHVQYGGSGLGLFISRHLTEMQGGEIGVGSEPGKGSTFAFYIKTRRCEAPDTAGRKDSGMDNNLFADTKIASQRATAILRDNIERPLSERHPNLSLEDSDNSLRSLRPLRVLVVEDNLVNQRVLSRQLRNRGCVVDVANHGGECLDYIQQTLYWSAMKDEGSDLSIILLDWEMPVMGGIECVQRIRKAQSEGLITAHIPVIGITANARGEQIQQAKAAGMDDVAPKPFQLSDLMEKIERLAVRHM